MNLKEVQAFLQDAEASGKLENQAAANYSKPTNFYLDCHETGFSFAQLVEQLAKEIEEFERVAPLVDTKRKNKRSAKARERFLTATRVLLLNALQVQQLIGYELRLAISLNNNDYGLKKRYAPPFITVKQLVAAYHGLIELGYLEIYKRGYLNRDTGEGMHTRFHGTDKLFALAEQITMGKTISFYCNFQHEDEVIVLRGTDKRQQEYEDNAFTRNARKNLEHINTTLSAHEFALALPETRQEELEKELLENYSEEPDFKRPYIDFTAIRLYRIFSDGSFTRGGRFYRGWWQNVPKAFRPLITIDGKSTVEMDYRTLHPSILYAEQGGMIDFDAYDINPLVDRKIGKVAFNALLNARGIPKPPPKFAMKVSGISWLDYLEEMKKTHSAIAHLFLQGYGLKVQYQDSQLAEDILLHFSNKGIACLPIHDSFIVSTEHQEELKRVMKESFFKRFKAIIEIDIK